MDIRLDQSPAEGGQAQRLGRVDPDEVAREPGVVEIDLLPLHDPLVHRLLVIRGQERDDPAGLKDPRPRQDGVLVDADGFGDVVRDELLPRKRGEDAQQVLELAQVADVDEL